MRLFRLLPLLLFRFRREALMVWAMLRSPEAPASAKFAAVLALAYLVSPIDLIPDVVPILGWLDDAAVVAALLAIAFRLLPKDLYDALRERTTGQGAASPRGRVIEAVR